jgi:hypothetical protein
MSSFPTDSPFRCDCRDGKLGYEEQDDALDIVAKLRTQCKPRNTQSLRHEPKGQRASRTR